jgi:hypothetical protein
MLQSVEVMSGVAVPPQDYFRPLAWKAGLKRKAGRALIRVEKTSALKKQFLQILGYEMGSFCGPKPWAPFEAACQKGRSSPNH